MTIGMQNYKKILISQKKYASCIVYYTFFSNFVPVIITLKLQFMKKTALILLCIMHFALCIDVAAQKHNAVTTNTTSGRFEIVQSRLLRSLTFKLDKHTGDVYMFDETMSDSTVWFQIPREIIETDTIPNENQINYQLFLGGYVARDCFLINLNNGITWTFIQNDKGQYIFELLK